MLMKRSEKFSYIPAKYNNVKVIMKVIPCKKIFSFTKVVRSYLKNVFKIYKVFMKWGS